MKSEATELAQAEEEAGHTLTKWKRWAVTAGVAVIIVTAIVAPAIVVKKSDNEPAPSAVVVADTTPLTSKSSSENQTQYPTAEPTVSSSSSPSESPTFEPSTRYPTTVPTFSPTTPPTPRPTLRPTAKPTVRLTNAPTAEPSPAPTVKPASDPTVAPSPEPTFAPTTTDPTAAVRVIVSRLSIQQFKDNIKSLSNFGDRSQGSLSYKNAAAWVKKELEGYGYTVEEHAYTFHGSHRTNMYVTKVGKTKPEQMYIVSAHLDGRGGGGAANDDGSGCSLVMEVARVLAATDVTLENSIRMIFWNNEETGLDGAKAYVNERATLQGKEFPTGSGLYPEPRWLGVVTHDQILFDHGLPVQENQIPNADSDIEYQADSAYALLSQAFANRLQAGNVQYAEDYPAEVSGDMCCTDSVPFQDFAPSVSIRENRRRAEIGNGSQPHWHQPTDLFSTFSEADFLFGFNVVQTTTGTICELSGLSLN